MGELASEKIELMSLREECNQLTAKLEKAAKRLAVLEEALEPRLKSILTLRSLRFALAQRNKIKRGEIDRYEDSIDDLLQPEMINEASASEYQAPTIPAGATEWNGLGIALFGHTRAACLRNTLESLARQDALHATHVFIDGDQGKPALRRKIDRLYEVVSAYPVKQIHRQRGHFGFRKIMLIAGEFMRTNYERIIFLEDDCFPVNGAIADFNNELDLIEQDESVFSVYGHHFLVAGESEAFPRFQGWGWATTRAKIDPIWEELKACYLLSEADYLSFVDENLTEALQNTIDATPGRQPSDTLRKFFAWDETVCLLAAMRGQRHKPSSRRLIYNCGAGLESSHFANLQLFREPPFNMIGADEVWEYFEENAASAP